jgi:hypothetical protein
VDELKSWIDLWPYRCLGCELRFFARLRRLPPRALRPRAVEQSDVAFQTHPERPVAQVVVRADSHEQLDAMLLAMNRAISNFNDSPSKKTEDERIHR